MMKIFSKLFKKPVNEQERRIEAEIAFRTQERNFRRYAAELDSAVDRFKQMAYDAEQKGQHSNALRAARFTRLLAATREKVEGVMQHFQLLRTLSSVGDMMVEFMDACNKLGCNLSEQIDVQALGQGEINMEEGLHRLSFISDKVEQAFEMITAGMEDPDAGLSASAEDEAFLKDIMGGQVKAAAEPAPVMTAAPVAPEPVKADAQVPPQEIPSDFASSLSKLNQKLQDSLA